MNSIEDLLPIPKGTETPNAYDVFGLQSGEQDMDTINGAVLSVIEHLKGVKDQIDPELWNQAARMVDHSRQILADPTRKSALDAKLQLESSSAPSGQSADPLAGLLPDGDPLLLPDQPVVVQPIAQPIGPIAQPIGPIAQPSGPIAQPGGRRRRRRQSATGKWMLAGMVLALFGAAGLLSYFVMLDEGSAHPAIRKNQISVGTNRTYQSDAVGAKDSDLSQPNERTTLNSQEPIMGGLAANTAGVRSDRFGQPSGIASGVDSGFASEFSGDNAESTESAKPAEMIGDPVSSSMPPTESTPDVPVLDESQQQKELDVVRALIREPNWAQMKIAAEELTKKSLATDNRVRAQGLYELADLATYYRGGIERAVQGLDVGNDFEVTDSLRVIVVEKAEDLLVVRYNKRNRSFKFDEFPFSLAHQLASFQIPAGTTRQAAKAAYQAIASKATDAHRDQSIEWLKAIDGEIEGADKDRLVQAIESIYSSAKE